MIILEVDFSNSKMTDVRIIKERKYFTFANENVNPQLLSGAMIDFRFDTPLM